MYYLDLKDPWIFICASLNTYIEMMIHVIHTWSYIIGS